jgi:hypothetical protein
VSSLNPELPVEPATETPVLLTNTTPWYKRLISKKNAKGLLAVSVFLSIEAFIVFGMPRLTTRFFLDSFWGSFEFFFMGIIIFSVCPCLTLMKLC